MDVRPNIARAYRIKFKAEVLPLKDEIGGYRVLYSHNCVFGLSQMHDADKNSMGTLARVFPVLAGLKKSDDEKVGLVNEGIVQEVLLELGSWTSVKGSWPTAMWRCGGRAANTCHWWESLPTRPSSQGKEDVAEKLRRNCPSSFSSRCSRTCKTGWCWA